MSNIGNIIHHQFILIYFDFLTFSVILNTTSQMHKHCMQAGKLTWTAGVPWSCGSWRRTSRPASLSCGSIPAQSLLCGGRTPAGLAAAGYETQTVAPSIWTVPPAGYGSLSIKRPDKNGMTQLFMLLSQQCTTCPGQKYPEKVKHCIFIVYYIIIAVQGHFFPRICLSHTPINI